jgi:hypothetical protein
LIVNIAILLPSAIAAAEAPPPLAPDALAKVIKEHADINQLYQLSGELMARLCELFPDLFLTGYTKRLIETALTHHNLVLSEFDHCDGTLCYFYQTINSRELTIHFYQKRMARQMEAIESRCVGLPTSYFVVIRGE